MPLWSAISRELGQCCRQGSGKADGSGVCTGGVRAMVVVLIVAINNII